MEDNFIRELFTGWSRKILLDGNLYVVHPVDDENPRGLVGRHTSDNGCLPITENNFSLADIEERILKYFDLYLKDKPDTGTVIESDVLASNSVLIDADQQIPLIEATEQEAKSYGEFFCIKDKYYVKGSHAEKGFDQKYEDAIRKRSVPFDPLLRAQVHSEIDQIPEDIMQLDKELAKQIRKWNILMANRDHTIKYPWDEKYFDVEFSRTHCGIEAQYTAKNIILKIIELTQPKPYKGIYFCSGHAPFKGGSYEYEDDEQALSFLRPFSPGNWTFVDIRFGKDPEKDKHLVDLCESLGMQAKLVKHDLNDGYPDYLGEGCYDITMLFDIKDTMPEDLQRQYAMRALKPKGLVFPSYIHFEENQFEYGGALIEKVFWAHGHGAADIHHLNLYRKL